MTILPRNNNEKERSSPQPPSSSTHISDVASSSTPAQNISTPRSMAQIIIPPGYKFAPSDTDVFIYYLGPFLQRKQTSFPNVPIHRVNIYETTPQELSMRYKKGNDKEWFFITERTKRCEGGKQIIRNDNGGFWKKTNYTEFEAANDVVCYKDTLEYYNGSEKGDWLMQEYSCNYGQKSKVDYAFCKIYFTPKEAKRRAEEEEDEIKKKKMRIEEAKRRAENEAKRRAEEVENANKKKKMRIVEEALEQEVDQPLNPASQQPQILSTSRDDGDEESSTCARIEEPVGEEETA